MLENSKVQTELSSANHFCTLLHTSLYCEKETCGPLHLFYVLFQLLIATFLFTFLILQYHKPYCGNDTFVS